MSDPLAPVPDKRTVNELAADIEAYLQQSPNLPGAVIRCEATQDGVLLVGHVPTYSMKHAARVLAEGRAGDKHVESRIDVIPYPAE